MGDLVGPGLAVFLPVDTDHLVDITFNIGLQMGEAVGDLVLREVPVTVVDGLEFAAIDGNAIALQHADPAAKLHELRAGPADRAAIRAAEFGDGLVIWCQSAGQPHQLDIAPRFPFQPAARRDPVQIAIDEQLQQNGGMVSRSASARGGRALNAEGRQIELIDEQIDDANKIILTDPVFQALGEKHRLATLNPLDETRHADLPLPGKHSMPPSFDTPSAERCVALSSGNGPVRRGIARTAPEPHSERSKQNILPTPHQPFGTTKSPAFWNERQDFLKLDRENLVGARGFEPPTPCSRSRCATRLRYAPTVTAELQSCPGICKGHFMHFSMYLAGGANAAPLRRPIRPSPKASDQTSGGLRQPLSCPRMIAITSTVFRCAVQPLMLSSIVLLSATCFRVAVTRISPGRFRPAPTRARRNGLGPIGMAGARDEACRKVREVWIGRVVFTLPR